MLPQCCPSSSHQGGLNAFPTWGCFWWHTLNNQAVYWATECLVAHNWYKRRWDPPLSWWKPSWALPCSLHLDQDPTAAGSEQCVHGLIPFKFELGSKYFTFLANCLCSRLMRNSRFIGTLSQSGRYPPILKLSQYFPWSPHTIWGRSF